MKKHDRGTIKVYYNSACPVCNAGISNQRKKIAHCPIDWKDIHTQSGIYKEVSSNIESVRERLYVVDKQGEIKVGMDAFIVIWKNSSRERWKATLVSLPVLKPLSHLLYNAFAHLLYKWNCRKGHWQPSPYQEKIDR